MNKHVKIYFLDWTENRISDKIEIERHLQECNSCRLYFEKMTKLFDPGVISGLPKLIPDPFMPTRTTALAEERRQANAKIMFSKLRLSLEGFALILAVVIGIMLGKAISAEPTQYKTNDILSIYYNALSQEDFSSKMESILEPLKGDNQ
jgi:predicted anti-sigma-YlaC factor YlaD